MILLNILYAPLYKGSYFNGNTSGTGKAGQLPDGEPLVSLDNRRNIQRTAAALQVRYRDGV